MGYHSTMVPWSSASLNNLLELLEALWIVNAEDKTAKFPPVRACETEKTPPWRAPPGFLRRLIFKASQQPRLSTSHMLAVMKVVRFYHVEDADLGHDRRNQMETDVESDVQTCYKFKTGSLTDAFDEFFLTICEARHLTELFKRCPSTIEDFLFEIDMLSLQPPSLLLSQLDDALSNMEDCRDTHCRETAELSRPAVDIKSHARATKRLNARLTKSSVIVPCQCLGR